MSYKLFFVMFFLGFNFKNAVASDNCEWSVGAGLGLSMPVGSSEFKDNANDDWGGSLFARKGLCNSLALQLEFDKHTFSDVDAENVDIGASALYYFSLNPLRPYAGLGLGMASWTDLSANTDRRLAYKAEVGIDWWFKPQWALNLALKYQNVDTQIDYVNRTQVLMPRVGIVYKLGEDNNGSSKISSNSKAPAIVAQVKTAALDSDGDGVNDDEDKCPSTAKNIKVNSYGCADKEKATVKVDVKFETGKSLVDKSYLDDVKKLAEFMKKNELTKVVINGHTDNTGSRNGNLQISKSRANAVLELLTKEYGISAERLSSVGHGPDKPVADNSTEAGRVKNRRVEAEIIQ